MGHLRLRRLRVLTGSNICKLVHSSYFLDASFNSFCLINLQLQKVFCNDTQQLLFASICFRWDLEALFVFFQHRDVEGAEVDRHGERHRLHGAPPSISGNCTWF